MYESIEKIFNECEEILLEFQILSEEIPQIKGIRDDVVGKIRTLDQSISEFKVYFEMQTKKLKDNMELQERQIKLTSEKLAEISGYLDKFDEIVKENQRLIQNNNENSKLIEELKRQIKDGTMKDSDVSLLGGNSAPKNPLEALLGSKKTIEEDTIDSFRKVHNFPDDAKYMTLDQEPNCSKHKPYGVWIKGMSIKVNSWPGLIEAFCMSCFALYDTKENVANIVKEGYEDGSGNRYFVKGNYASKKYKYLSDFKLSIYITGANETVKMMQAICEYYEIDTSNVYLYYCKKA